VSHDSRLTNTNGIPWQTSIELDSLRLARVMTLTCADHDTTNLDRIIELDGLLTSARRKQLQAILSMCASCFLRHPETAELTEPGRGCRNQ